MLPYEGAFVDWSCTGRVKVSWEGEGGGGVRVWDSDLDATVVTCDSPGEVR